MTSTLLSYQLLSLKNAVTLLKSNVHDHVTNPASTLVYTTSLRFVEVNI